VTDFRQLLEARIREYHQRRAKGELRPAPERTGGEPLETILMKKIRDLRKQAREARGTGDEETRHARLEEAQRLETQLMVLLESTGRPLAAKLMAERLRAPDEVGDADE
jgi:hypothetical protein